MGGFIASIDEKCTKNYLHFVLISLKVYVKINCSDFYIAFSYPGEAAFYIKTAASLETAVLRRKIYCNMALPARFERATFRLGGGCSILLSYGSKFESLCILTQNGFCVNK